MKRELAERLRRWANRLDPPSPAAKTKHLPPADLPEIALPSTVSGGAPSLDVSRHTGIPRGWVGQWLPGEALEDEGESSRWAKGWGLYL